MKKSFVLYILYLPLLTYCQLFNNVEIGIINDKDGYTFIREGYRTSTPIKDTIFEGEFFQFIPNDTLDWYQVRKWEHKIFETDSIDWMQLYKKRDLPGFVHKSRIINIKNLQKSRQYRLIDSLFNIEVELYNENISVEELYINRVVDYEEIYTPILDLFISYMCQYKDEKLFKKFLDILIINSGSAYETPLCALGYIYLCQPEMLLKNLYEYKSDIINDNLVFGFLCVSTGREEEIENYYDLKRKIEELTTTNKH